MGTHGWRSGALWAAVAAAGVLVVALGALVVQADGEASLVDEATRALWWLGVAIVGGALALAAWWLERRRGPGAAQESKALRERVQALERRTTRERQVNRELRRQIAELQHTQGTFGDWGDIRTLVLRTAMTLTDAPKGMLLTHPEDDTDGSELRLVAHEGFEADPSEHAAARRFARDVVQQDTIVREEAFVAIPIYVHDQFTGVVVCIDREDGFDDLDDEVLLALGDQAGAALHNTRLHDELRTSYVSTIRVLAEAIQAKDPFLRGHSEEVSDYVSAVAGRLGFDTGQRERLAIGSLLHDLGKIGISERILHKPARLTQEEYAIIQLHPRIGYRLIEQVPALKPVASAILHHHERYDGGGYPTGLKGEQIPLEARIVGVADAFSAMTADRPYRSRMPLDEACEELQRNAGTQFDPEIVRIFVEEVRKHVGADGASRDGDGPAGPVAEALDDIELQVHRQDDEPVLGAGAQALTDSLTLLYGHRYLHEAASAEAERARIQERAFAVALVHCDDVERVNASEGYAAGDAHLRSCARSLSHLAVRLGATACREGGLTLALLVPASRTFEPDVLAMDMKTAMAGCGPVRVAVETWRPGDTGDAVIARAQASLGAADPVS
ncbi:MAG TPA: HD domain-containing phosphohydrolase [Solirubrobacteraceae bacterium]|nr:HD domain-containing phosphohydrolase [Solirubrobacteraceae bacterium]